MRTSAGIVIALMVVLLSAGCGGTVSAPPVRSPSPGSAHVPALVFAYGVGATNVFDTSAGTFTKDLILDPPATVPLALSDAELARIADKLDEIDFMDYPAVFTPSPGPVTARLSPYYSYRLAVTVGSETKTVAWDDEFATGDSAARQLRRLARLIIATIESHPEYQRLPEPRGGYL